MYLQSRDYLLKEGYTNYHELPQIKAICVYKPFWYDRCVDLHLITAQRPKLMQGWKYTRKSVLRCKLTLRNANMRMYIDKIRFGIPALHVFLKKKHKPRYAMHTSNTCTQVIRLQDGLELHMDVPSGSSKLSREKAACIFLSHFM